MLVSTIQHDAWCSLHTEFGVHVMPVHIVPLPEPWISPYYIESHHTAWRDLRSAHYSANVITYIMAPCKHMQIHQNTSEYIRTHQNTSEHIRNMTHIMHMTHQYTSVIITSRALHLHMRCSRTKDLHKLDDVGRSKRTSRTPSDNWTTTDLNKPGQTLALKTEQSKGSRTKQSDRVTHLQYLQTQ